MKFKVGDRVKVIVARRGYSVGDTAEIVRVDADDDRYVYRIKFDKPISGDSNGLWWIREDHLAPASPVIPDGWTTADEPPKTQRDVRVMLSSGGKVFGWFHRDCGWLVYPSNITAETVVRSANWKLAAPGEVICWREIQPERLRVGQRVRVKENPRGARWYKAGDVGVVLEDDVYDDKLPYHVEFDGEGDYWCYEGDLEPLPDETKPEPEDDEPYYIEYVVMDDAAQVHSGAHDHKTIMGLAEADARNGKVAVYKKVAEITRGPLVVKMF